MKKITSLAASVTPARLPLVAGILTAFALSGCGSATNDIDQLTVTYDNQQQQYELHWQASDPAQPVTIAVASAEAPDSYRTLVEGWSEGSYQWKVDDGDKRRYFKVVPKEGQAAAAAARWLPLEGGRNFRDLGGYMTADGQQVRWGKLFRTGAMSGLTDQDYQLLETLNIGTVVDFRTAPERNHEPTRWQNPQTEILSWDYTMEMGAFADIFRQPDLTPEKVEQAMAAQYPALLEQQQPHYQAMFDRLLSKDQGLVFNCTAGKDRTGIAAALILTALGVDRETVVEDFMLSEIYYQQNPTAFSSGQHEDAIEEGARAQGEPAAPHNPNPMAQLPPELVAPLMGVRESYINTTFDYMEQQAGSALAYVQQTYQLDDAKLQQLRSLYLQSPQP